MRVRTGALLAVTLSCACRELPGVFVGESTHFRLYVSSGVEVPPGLEGEKALTALETNWTDTATLLPLDARRSVGKIEYRWVVPGDLSSACEPGVGGCELEGPIVVALELPFQHELNHAYMELITGTNAHPVPLLTEGIASAIGCGQGFGARLDDPTRWQELIAGNPRDEGFARDGYPQGALLVRYLIRTRGIDAFIAYYEQAPKVRTPALFADNFQRFWGMSIDAVWSAMKTMDPGESLGDTSLCPCSLPSPPLDQPLADDPATTPYWTIPDARGKTIALQAGPSHIIRNFDCLGQRFDGPGASPVALVRLGAGVRGYVLAPLAGATVGDFISDTCEGAEPFAVPSDLMGLGLGVQVDRSLAAARWVYLQLQAPPGATTLSVPSAAVSACATCAFDTPTCPAGVALSPQGTTYVRLPLTPSTGSDARSPPR